MKPEEQRIAIAEACGWRDVGYLPNGKGDKWLAGVRPGYPDYPNPAKFDIPDYLTDLNAMHEAEKVLSPEQLRNYLTELAKPFCRIVGYEWEEGFDKAISAPANARAEAFLRTIGKWTSDGI